MFNIKTFSAQKIIHESLYMPLFGSYHILMSSVIYINTKHMHGNMESTH